MVRKYLITIWHLYFQLNIISPFFGFIPTLSVTYFPKLLMKMFWYSLSTLWKKTPKCPTKNLVQQIPSSNLNVSLWDRVQWAIYVILLRSFLHPCATAEYLPSTYFYRWYKWRTGLPYSDINLRLDKQSYENIIHNCHRHVFINNQNMGPEFFNRDSLHDSCCLGVVAFIWHQVMFSSSFFRSQW